jgi:16S rRNA (cytosine967-C5)-methyltransferase
MSGINDRFLLSHLRTAEQILAHYEGPEPFPIFLKAFFRENRKFGSRDRKEIARFCYASFRLGDAMPDMPLRERILAGIFLCHDGQDKLMQAARPEWVPAMDLPLADKERFLQAQYPGFTLLSVFPLISFLSEGIDPEAFVFSHFTQPDLFIRLRPGHEARILALLEAAGIPFVRQGKGTLSLPNGTDLSPLGSPDQAYVVQDLSSQRTAEFLPSAGQMPVHPLVWDACAGSGGKSLMVHDSLPGCMLDLSDERPGILHNLEARFSAAGIKGYRTAVLDLTEKDKRKNAGSGALPRDGYDLVIADVPCSGSGTWARTPWEMPFLGEQQLAAYAERQRRIVDRLVRHVKKGGHLLYITCSVYRQENEDVVAHVMANSSLKVVRQGLIKGYGQRADTMFAALFTSPA